MSLFKKPLLLLFAMSISLPSAAHAEGWRNGAIITRIALEENGRAYIHVEPSTSAPGKTVPACSTNGTWHAVFNSQTPRGQAMLSMAISAKLSKTPVLLVGQGVCTIAGSVETISLLELKAEN